MAYYPGDHNKIDPASDKDQAKKGYYRDPRVSFMLSKEDILVQCPYDAAHWILKPKMILHLTRCRNNYNKEKEKKRKIEVCMYDYLHHVPADELEHHQANCPTVLERQKQEKDDKEAYENLMKTHGIDLNEARKEEAKKEEEFEERRLRDGAVGLKLVTEDESWEDDPNAETTRKVEKDGAYTPVFTGYDPRKKVKANQHKLLLNPQGLTKSERRQHREKLAEWCLDEEKNAEETTFSARKRDIRVPVGYPGWDIDDGDRRATPASRRDES